jgi:radical SAM protein (TIGR01212 family)
MKIRRISDELKKKYGQKIYKLSLSAGCTCPNRDGSLGFGGCTFCSEGGSGDFAARPAPAAEQIAEARRRIDPKLPKSLAMKDRRFIAYFQSFTNTYGDTGRLEQIFSEAEDQPEIVGLSIGTRPDCLEDDKISMLKRLNERKPVWVELGLQTIHEETACRIHRGYSLPVFEDAYRRLKQAGLTVIVHVILGLPRETEEMMLQTVRYLASLDPHPDGVKLQLLHILKGTRLAEEYQERPFPVFTMEEYCRLVVKCLKILPEDVVIHRLTGDGPKKLLVAPLWSADKKRVLNMLNRYIEEA